MTVYLLLALTSILAVPAGSTLQARPQEVAEQALRDALRATVPQPEGGSIVVIDLQRKALVAVATGPERGRQRAGEALPAGSVVKPFVALSLLDRSRVDPAGRTPCPARLPLAGALLRNHVAMDLPAMRLDEALAHSCNTVFYALASRAWRDGRFHVEDTMRAFGFGRATGLLPGEDAGFVPRVTSEREALSLAIGQASLLVTPVQMAVAYASLALRAPVVLKAQDGEPTREIGSAHVHPLIGDGLRGTTTYGTAAHVFVDVPLEIAAKTGTAESGARPVAWFAAYAPAAAPRYVVVAAFEDAGFGADVAAPAVRDVLEALFALPSSRERFLDWRLGLIILVSLAGVAGRTVSALRRHPGPTPS